MIAKERVVTLASRTPIIPELLTGDAFPAKCGFQHPDRPDTTCLRDGKCKDGIPHLGITGRYPNRGWIEFSVEEQNEQR